MRITRWNKITLIDDEMYKDVKKKYTDIKASFCKNPVKTAKMI